jgi:hypothetical protein
MVMVTVVVMVLVTVMVIVTVMVVVMVSDPEGCRQQAHDLRGPFLLLLQDEARVVPL